MIQDGQITFTQFVQSVGDDGDVMACFERFCLSAASRLHRRPWMASMDTVRGDGGSDGDGAELKEDGDGVDVDGDSRCGRGWP